MFCGGTPWWARNGAWVDGGGWGLIQMVEKRDGCRDGDETEGDEGWFPGDHAGAGSFELFAEFDQAIGGVGMGEDFHLPVGNFRGAAGFSVGWKSGLIPFIWKA